uniref:non-specific serine/threonine protein kinase n=1 Tax=Chenopodium quinoa TaxID=63459 RepID=A0A803LTH8_CHEQI
MTDTATCEALAGYVTQSNTTLGDIQFLFQVKSLTSLLLTNFLPPSTPRNFLIYRGQTVRIPFPCRCKNGTGLSDGLPVHIVTKAESGKDLNYISKTLFNSLTTDQLVKDVNHLEDSDTLIEGQKLWIPLPCSCDDEEGQKVVHYAHAQLQTGHPSNGLATNTGQIAAKFGINLRTLQKLNNLTSNEPVYGKIIDIPLQPPTAPSQVDGAAMKSLATTLGHPFGWSGDKFCMWQGVICDNNGFVKSISYPSSNLSGILPSNLSSLSQLSGIFLQGNQLSGPLPSFNNLALLQEIHLESNNFTSVPNGAFSGLSSLRILSLEDNLSLRPWGFPAELVSSPNLVGYFASNANLIGQIPDIFSSLTSLQNLRLSCNNLTGSLPFSFHGSRIRNLKLDNQHMGLSGTLDVLAWMTRLREVWLQKNYFTGTIPNLSNCTRLSNLRLDNNLLTGPIPPSLISLYLVNISLHSNKLQGPFPSYPKQLTGALENNSFCKDIAGECDPYVSILLEVAGALGYPLKLAEAWHGNDVCNKWEFVTCDASRNVTAINISRQGFSGNISQALVQLTYLRQLYLNDNKLTGTIPDSLTTLSQLTEIDVSNNDLRGQVPSFRSSVTVLTSGNRNIKPITSTTNGTTPNTTAASDRSSGKMAKIIPGVLVPSIAIVGLGILVYIYKKKRHETESKEDLEQWGNSQLAPDSQTRFTYKALKMATNNFDMHKKLGGGGLGTVFEGSLSDGSKVAVKRLDCLGQGRKEFLAEVRTMGSIHHLNLVKLLGFCVENSHRLLVYEYMSKGSLDKWIFDINSRDNFTWDTKKKIIVHIAKGLAYLHEECHKKIVHLDVKPQNVLLDDEFNAKISDFGLAKLIDRDQNYVMTQMRGTRGYLAPEWLGRKITEKADVYSYGVVVLEVIFGRKNLDCSHPEESTLIMQVKKKEEESQLLDLLDTCSEDMLDNYEDIEKTISLAIRCLHSEPAGRPPMSMVVKILEGVTILEDIDNYSLTSPLMTEISDSVLSGPR